MLISVELYKENGDKMCFIAADDGASGAEYPYKTADDIGKNVATYLDCYYPGYVENPDLDEEEDI